MPDRVGLRVGIDATPLLGQPTGVGAFVAGAMGELARDPDLGLTAYALSLRGGRGLGAHLPAGVNAAKLPLPANVLLAAWALADVPPIEWWTGPVDVIHATNFVSPPSRRAAEVVTVHDLTPLRHPELAAPATRPFPALVRRALARGAMVHTPSAYVKAEVVELLGAHPDRVRSIHHGVPSGVVAGASPPPSKGPVRGPYVLALGTVEPRKALPLLVHAFDLVAADHPDLSLVVAGPKGWGEDALSDARARAHHGDRVVRLGWQDPPAAASLLAGAQVLAFPSLYEGFGFPPLQAMAAGVPVVASRGGALPEVLGDGAQLVNQSDADSLAEGLALVLGDDELRATLVARGRRRAADFSWTACARGLAELYRDAVETRSGR